MELINEAILIKLIDERITQREPPKVEKLETWWDMKDLMRETKKSNKWLTDMLNYPPFKKQLLGIVFYPKSNREGYSMIADKMREWLITNHEVIRSSASKFRTY